MSNSYMLRLCSVLVLFLVLTGCNQADPESVTPDITLPSEELENDLLTIDGVLQPGEWDQAEIYYFEDGSELYLFHSDNHVYLAIKAISDEMISANVFISSGERIDILHTSAALGTANYQPEGDSWRRTKDFEWCCRSRIDNASAWAFREAFYHTENWLGINTYNGTENELEYKILLTGSEKFLAVNFLRVNNIDDKQVWPVGISDGPAQPTIGGFPDLLDFSPENWFVLEVDQ